MPPLIDMRSLPITMTLQIVHLHNDSFPLGKFCVHLQRRGLGKGDLQSAYSMAAPENPLLRRPLYGAVSQHASQQF